MQQQVTTEVSIKETQTVVQSVVNVGPNYQPFCNLAIGQKFRDLKTGALLMKIGNDIVPRGMKAAMQPVIRVPGDPFDTIPVTAVALEACECDGVEVKVGQVVHNNEDECVILVEEGAAE